MSLSKPTQLLKGLTEYKKEMGRMKEVGADFLMRHYHAKDEELSNKDVFSLIGLQFWVRKICKYTRSKTQNHPYSMTPSNRQKTSLSPITGKHNIKCRS